MVFCKNLIEIFHFQQITFDELIKLICFLIFKPKFVFGQNFIAINFSEITFQRFIAHIVCHPRSIPQRKAAGAVTAAACWLEELGCCVVLEELGCCCTGGAVLLSSGWAGGA